jgi:predicted GNAT family N-acyltransferase|tara:strand:+ start:298 stop:741 length:444 start_codon:yes stop_codon:yes gene_type:complete
MELISPKTKDEFSKYYLLRYNILRKPWKQLPGSEQDESDKDSIHRMIVDSQNGNALAVGRLHYNSNEEAQIRYMAVDDDAQGRGLGTKLIIELESIAKQANMKWVILQARENAVSFYKSNGYEIVKKTHLLFNEIQHWLMKKNLSGS